MEDTPLADLHRLRIPDGAARGAVSPLPVPTRTVRSYATAVRSVDPPGMGDGDTDDDNTSQWRTQRRLKHKPTDRTSGKPKHPKPPAVLVQTADGKSFEDTLKAVKEAVDPSTLGVGVKRICRTQGGHLLVELVGGAKAAGDAATLAKAVRDTAAGLTGRVVPLGALLEVEVVGLDPCVEKEEVKTALDTAMERYAAADVAALKAQVEVTGLWRVRDGTGIATAKIPRTAADLTELKVGWTIARVKSRRPDPLRCYRCHGFGYSTFRCTGPDMSGKCRRCGEPGHLEKDCAEAHKCVACDRLGRQYKPHRTGSGDCLARRECRANGGGWTNIVE